MRSAYTMVASQSKCNLSLLMPQAAVWLLRYCKERYMQPFAFRAGYTGVSPSLHRASVFASIRDY